MEPILSVKNLSVEIKTANSIVHAVDDISFNIYPGKTLALIGESGCGKSMTALASMRLLPQNAAYAQNSEIVLHPPDTAKFIRILDLPESEMRQLRGCKLAMIFQDPMSCLNPVLTIGEQIAEVFKLHQPELSIKRIRLAVLELLKKVQIPDPERRIKSYPHELSGGMKQRVMIAMAIAAKPCLLIADEPTTALDVSIQAQILQLLKQLSVENNMAMLLITHDLGVAATVADDIALMYAGHLIEQASAAEFFAAPYHPYAKQLLKAQPSLALRNTKLSAIPGRVPLLTSEFIRCRFLDRCYRADALCQQQLPPFSNIAGQNMQPRRARCHYPDATSPPSGSTAIVSESPRPNQDPEILTVDSLRVYYPIKSGILRRVVGQIKAVDNVSFKLKAGETLAIVGESGSGKSTIARAILALEDTNSGVVNYQGNNILALSARRLKNLRTELQIIFQDPYAALDPRMRVLDIIAEGIQEHAITASSLQLTARIDELLLQVGLDPSYKWRYPHEFSGGQRQRICIARALSLAPKLIICDEPTSALDISVQAQVLNLLKDIQQHSKLAYIFISHNIAVVGYMADWIAVMHAGKIVEYGSAVEVLQDPKHAYTKMLLASAMV